MQCLISQLPMHRWANTGTTATPPVATIFCPWGQCWPTVCNFREWPNKGPMLGHCDNTPSGPLLEITTGKAQQTKCPPFNGVMILCRHQLVSRCVDRTSVDHDRWSQLKRKLHQIHQEILAFSSLFCIAVIVYVL